LGRREFADFGKVDVLSGVENVTANDPVGGGGIVEPGEFGFVGVATVAGFFEDLFYFGWGLEVGGDGWVGEGGADELDCEEKEDDDAGSAEEEAEHVGTEILSEKGVVGNGVFWMGWIDRRGV
jgi:hypothetical protein